MSQDHVETVRQIIDAWNRGDREGWLRPAHPDVEWSSAVIRELEGSGAVYRGREEAQGFWDEWHSVWDIEVELTEVREVGDTVLALALMRTRGLASGAELERPVGYVVEFEGELVRRMRAYLSREEAVEAAGLTEWAMPRDNVALVERMVADFNERGIGAARDFGHPDIEFHEPPEQPGARVARGIEQVIEFFSEFDSAWESHRTEPLDIRAVGEDKVLLESLEHFVGRDGLEVEARHVGVYTLEDGKVLRWQAFWDRERALEAAGLSE